MMFQPRDQNSPRNEGGTRDSGCIHRNVIQRTDRQPSVSGTIVSPTSDLDWSHLGVETAELSKVVEILKYFETS